MKTSVIFRYKLMIFFLRIVRTCLPFGMGNTVSSWLTPLIHPLVNGQKPAYCSALSRYLHSPGEVEKAWRFHKDLVGVAQHQSNYYLYAPVDWIEKLQVSITGAEYVRDALAARKGVLVMTYHHHFNMLFCSLLGRLKHPVTTIAMDPKESAMNLEFGEMAKRMYDNAAAHFQGGNFAMVKPNGQIRPIIRALDKNQLVVTANDFLDPFSEKTRMVLPFLDTELSCPTGTVKLAVKKQVPIVAGYLLWKGSDRYELVLKPLTETLEKIDVHAVMAAYLGILTSLIEEYPGQWEGWKWLK